MRQAFVPRPFQAAANWTAQQGRTAALALAHLAVAAIATAAEPAIQYNRDIRPILAEACFKCHGPDSASRQADLRLDQRDMAMDMTAIVPGKPDESELVRRIFSTDPDEAMPPKVQQRQLKPEEKELLKKWIEAGAEYQVHWSFIAPARPMAPSVKNAAWVRNPIDSFVLAKLESMGLSPAPEADRRTLARRLALDLTGLPPVPELVEAFVNDQSDDAYGKLVDKLLESERWGEHRGRYWLDAARYADTHGIHFDNYREMWSYRDWVIKAFNANMRFDQFTTEQLAGDLLPNRTLDQQIASGFNRCNITTNEGGTIPEEYLVLYARDRTETTSQVWLGMTTGCAVCHDHKFDPLKQREFYELAAFFNNTTQPAMDGNIKDTPPITMVPTPEDRPRWEQLQQELAGIRSQVDERKKAAQADFDKWLASVQPADLAKYVPTEGLHAAAPLDEGSGTTLKVSVDGNPRELSLGEGYTWGQARNEKKALSLQPGPVSVELPDVGDFEADQGFSASLWVSLGRRGQTGALVARMDNTMDFRGWDMWMEGDKVGMHIINKWQSDALKVVCQTPLEPRKWTHVTVSYDGSKKAAGVKVYYNGQLQPVSVQADALQNTIKTAVPLKIGQRHTSERLSAVTLQDLRIYKRTLAPQECEQLAKIDQLETYFAKAADKRTPEERNQVFDWYLATLDQPSRDLDAKVKSLQQDEVQLKSRGTIAHVMQEKTDPAIAFVLFRGEYDKRRDQVSPDTPDILPPLPQGAAKDRLSLARWLLASEHPLTARVTVNRFWQELFGTGLVRTSGDFGVAGELPSNQDLLDWLAVDFRESGWDIKRFFKQVVMSATYRQAAIATPQKLEKDPQNRFFSRGPRFRMDAEMVRDYALAASGLLSAKIGGPSVKPYQPDGVWEAVAMIGSNTRDYKADNGESLYRRSMYTFWKRAAPPASMEIFNAPAREVCTVRRERTNTPLQALVTLNDPQFVEAARRLAENTLKSGGESDDSRIDYLAWRLLARPFSAAELAVVKQSLADLAAYYAANEADARQLIATGESKPDAALDPKALAAWTMLANELMNLDEVLSK
jgi:cytochrome c553